MKELLSMPWVRAAIKVVLVLLATALATLVFGLLVPFFLLAIHLLPSLGVGGVVYLMAGGLFGLLGGLWLSIRLVRGERLVPRAYLQMVGVLSGLAVLYAICHLSMAERFSHI